jgi:hypothetical protein
MAVSAEGRLERRFTTGCLDFVPLEQLVLLTPRALGALQAANQQKRHPYRDQEGQQVGIRREPVS